MDFISPSSVNSIVGLLLVCGYYAVLWFRSGASRYEPVVTRYKPPRDLSPAMMRFIWKQRFDDRTFWACVLSLASKGLATLEDENGDTYVRPTDVLLSNPKLSGEDAVLVRCLFKNRSRKRISLDIANDKTAATIWEISQYFHRKVASRWFRSNYRSVLVGTALSLASAGVVASPRSLDHWGVLLLGLGAMAPGGYYGFFILLRMLEVFGALRKHVGAAVLGRAATLFGLLIPCLAAFVLGGVVLGGTFGIAVLVVTACLVAVNVVCLMRLRFPTADGQKLLHEIEGFREFLLSVERLPWDRLDAPDDDIGLYEKYLPYAVALEVEQAWCDRLVALKSVSHEQELMPGVRPFYLGMWDGSPVEIVYKPEAGRRM